MQWEFTMHAIPLSGKHTNKLQLGHNRPSSLTYIIHSPSQSPFFDNQLGFPPTFSQLLSSLYLQSASRSLPSHECGNAGEPDGRRENSLGPLNRPAYLRARSHSLSLSLPSLESARAGIHSRSGAPRCSDSVYLCACVCTERERSSFVCALDLAPSFQRGKENFSVMCSLIIHWGRDLKAIFMYVYVSV